MLPVTAWKGEHWECDHARLTTFGLDNLGFRNGTIPKSKRVKTLVWSKHEIVNNLFIILWVKGKGSDQRSLLMYAWIYF